MKKSNLIKVFSVLVLSVMVILMCNVVNAADNTSFNEIDLSTQLQGNNSSNNAANANKANTNSNTSNTNKANNASNNANKANTNNNSSIYNNSNLPKTGVESSLPIAALVVVLGISAVYAYKKIKDYRNI